VWVGGGSYSLQLHSNVSRSGLTLYNYISIYILLYILLIGISTHIYIVYWNYISIYLGVNTGRPAFESSQISVN